MGAVTVVGGSGVATLGANSFTGSQTIATGSLIFGAATSGGARINGSGSNLEFNRGDNLVAANTFQLGMTAYANVTAHAATVIPAGGTAGAGIFMSATANFGLMFGSGAPSAAATKGTLYLRSDGSGINDRAYINTNGSTTWTPIVTVA